MCLPKEEGGLGFGDWRAFNTTFLAKQGWRLQSCTNTLVHKVFKARYFPNGDFLSAKLGHHPSYAWRSILLAQSIVQSGYQWQVRNGESIRVWHDKWFPTPSTFKITSPPVGLPLDAQVSTLINHLNKCWHTNLIRQAFSSKDATTILGIPLSSRLLVDHLI